MERDRDGWMSLNIIVMDVPREVARPRGLHDLVCGGYRV